MTSAAPSRSSRPRSKPIPEKNGLLEEASATYRAYLRLDPSGVFADAAKIALQHLPQLRGEGIPAKPELPTSLPSENPR
jgi:hypothetical protein